MLKVTKSAGWLGLALLLVLPVVSLRAQESNPTNAPGFKLVTTRHELTGLDYYFRTVATVGTNQFAFIVPKGYFIRADEANRQLRAVERDDKCSITVRLFTAPTNAVDQATGALKAEAFREVVQQRFSNPRIVEEFALTAGGRPGPAFDLAWKNEAGLSLQSRIAFIPTVAGVMEFHLLTTGADMKEFKYALNTLMLTVRVGETGKLALPELSDKL